MKNNYSVTIKKVKINQLVPLEKNPKKHAVKEIQNSIEKFGYIEPIIVDENCKIISGHGRVEVLRSMGVEEVDAVVVTGLSEREKRQYSLIANKIVELGGWDEKILSEIYKEDKQLLIDAYFTDKDFAAIKKFIWDEKTDKNEFGKLVREFVYPPVSVLDTRSKVWLEHRKKWYDYFGEDIVQTKENLLRTKSSILSTMAPSSSRFDPVIAQIVYTWYSQPGFYVLNPTCGEASPGIVAGVMDRRYLGVDVRQEQVDWNNELAKLYNLSDKVKFIRYNSCRLNEILQDEKFDLVFFSPPYYGIELYSFEDEDISKQGFEEGFGKFCEGYEKIIRNACDKLKENRFAVIRVGESIETKCAPHEKSKVAGMITKTIEFFEKSGTIFWDQIVIVNSMVSVPVRARKQFKKRKTVRVHQFLLVFFKGDVREIPKIYTTEYEPNETTERILTKFKNKETAEDIDYDEDEEDYSEI